MNSRRTLVVGGATVTLALCAGAAFALSESIDDRTGQVPVALQTTSSPGDLPSTSTTATTEPTEPTGTSTHSTRPTSLTLLPPPPAGAIGAEEATAIALAWVGGGHVVRVQHELEHGRFEWKVRIMHAGQEWDVRVDAGTGTVTRSEHRDGDDRRGRHGDDGDHDDYHDKYDDRSGPGGGGHDDDDDDRSGSGGGRGKG